MVKVFDAGENLELQKSLYTTLETATSAANHLIKNDTSSTAHFINESLYFDWLEKTYPDYFNHDSVTSKSSEDKKGKARQVITLVSLENPKIANTRFPQYLSFLGFLLSISDTAPRMEKSGSKPDSRRWLYQALGSNPKLPKNNALVPEFITECLKAIKERGPLSGLRGAKWSATGVPKIHNIKDAWFKNRLKSLKDLAAIAVEYPLVFPALQNMGRMLEDRVSTHSSEIKDLVKKRDTYPPFELSELAAFLDVKLDKGIGENLTFLIGCFGFRSEEIQLFERNYPQYLRYWCHVPASTSLIPQGFDFKFKYKLSHYEINPEAQLIGVAKKHKVDPKKDAIIPPYLVAIFRGLQTGLISKSAPLALKMKPINNKWIKFTKNQDGETNRDFQARHLRNLKATGLQYITFSDNPTQSFRFKSSSGIYLAQERGGHTKPTTALMHYATVREESNSLDDSWLIDQVPFRFFVLLYKDEDGVWWDLFSNQYVYDAILLYYFVRLIKTYKTAEIEKQWMKDIFHIWSRYGQTNKSYRQKNISADRESRAQYKKILSDFEAHLIKERIDERQKVELRKITGMDKLQEILEGNWEMSDLMEKYTEIYEAQAEAEVIKQRIVADGKRNSIDEINEEIRTKFYRKPNSFIALKAAETEEENAQVIDIKAK